MTLKRRLTFSSFMKGIILIVCFIVITNTIFAFSAQPKKQKSVVSVQIQKGDTLWSIAKEYITEEYRSIHDYIEEIKQSNGIVSDIIHEGNHIIVPYYTDNMD